MKRLLVVLIVLAVACGPGPTPPKKSPSPVATTPVARPSLPPFPSPTAGGPTPPPPVAVVCSSQVPAGHQVALVSLHGVQGVVVRDVTDINHPVTRCGFQGGAYFRFVNSARVSYIVTSSGDVGASGAIYMVDLNQSTTSLVRAWSSGGYGSWVYAWSPDGQKLTYLASDTTGVTWHLLSAAGDKTLASLGMTPARGVALDNDDIMVGFSADGQYVAVESTFTTQKGGGASAPAIQIVRLSDLKQIYMRADGTMATWGATGASFYFRTTAGLLVRDATGKDHPANPALQWIRPWPSADGTHITFSSLNPQGNHVVGILDTGGGPVAQATSEPRANPGLLTSTLLWHPGETPCPGPPPSGLGGPSFAA